MKSIRLLLISILALSAFGCERFDSTADREEVQATDAQAAIDEQSIEMSDDEVTRRFYEIWSDTESPTIWHNRWAGIPTLQNPMDVWITQEILHEVKPDFIVETGTFHGGSAIMWATFLSAINPEGRIITVDIEDNTAEAKKNPIFQEKVDFYLGSSTDPEITAEIAERVKGKKVLVILDSLHTKDHVLDELEIYGDMVSTGSYMIVQDGFLNGHPITLGRDHGPGPWEAVEAFMPTTENFEIDKGRERLILTWNPNGYLKRVR